MPIRTLPSLPGFLWAFGNDGLSAAQMWFGLVWFGSFFYVCV